MMRTKSGLLFLVIAGLIGPARGQRVPTIDELIGLETIRSVRIAPSGEWIAYTTSVADFDGDTFVSRIRLVDVGSGRLLALTRGPGSAFDPKWSPDGARLAFVSNREGEGSQLYTISPRGGAAVRLTESETGVSSYEWSPDGTSIAFIARDGEPDARAARTASVGDFTVVRREYRRNHLWLVDVPEAPPGPLAARRLTAGDGFHVRSFAWSPDGSRIAFSAAVSPDVVDRHTSDVYVLELRRGAARKIVEAPGPDDSPHWSPDGASIVYVSHFGRERYFGHNSDFALVPSTGGEPVSADRVVRRDPHLRDVERGWHLLPRPAADGLASLSP
jgi:Tol biopolymer transport system component